MNIEITINYEITQKEMENLADDYLQMIVDNCEGDEELYREEYANLLDDDIDLLTYIEDYEFPLDDENYFTGLHIEISQRFDLCERVRKIALKKMEEDLKNFE